jgi:hypothetical protein
VGDKTLYILKELELNPNLFFIYAIETVLSREPELFSADVVLLAKLLSVLYWESWLSLKELWTYWSRLVVYGFTFSVVSRASRALVKLDILKSLFEIVEESTAFWVAV